ncbi:MAG TPA: iron-containing alcohol dehydrogenase [Solirubrobacterales bacterium]|nr:iron-containing alcohol dehydrogenase [Solirubrobacterales bacterium]
MAEHDFTWRDVERTIVFRAGALADSPEILAGGIWERFELLTTTRALGAAPVELAERATVVHQVEPGEVPYVAAAIVDSVRNPTLVALGGGRVIDVAKAIAAVRGGRVCAIPTTLSGAEMTGIHRLPAGREQDAQHRVRPSFVIADPFEMTTLDDRSLRASAMNALAHGAEALYVPLANPVASLAALRGAELIATALDRSAGERDRAGLGLGALLCAYALDTTGYALHHVVCQTLVRMVGTPHAETNATMLPTTMNAMRPRAPEEIASLARALGVESHEIRLRIESLGGGPRRLRDLGGNPNRLESARHAILQRPELANTPDPPGPEELRRLLEDAW